MEPAAALAAIGNTPLLRLGRLSPPGGAEVWAKWEAGNPTGSMKDRMALSMVEGAERRGELRPGMRVVEFTGGSTGSSLSLICAAKGYRAHLVTSDAFSDEKVRTMRAFGAVVDVLPSDGGRITPDLAARMRARVQELDADADTLWTHQFENPDNVAGYRRLGEELLEQTGGRIDAWVMGVGTGGCFSGVAETLEQASPSVLCVAVEPAGSRNLSGGPLVGHHIEGIGIGFLPDIVRLDLADAIEAVSDEEAYAGARELARTEAVFAGVTSGANLRVAQRVAERLGPGKRVVTVFADSGLKYLAGELFA